MATIDSVKFYMSRTANRTGWNIYCSIRAIDVYTSDPGNSSILGTSDAVIVDDVPLHDSQDWVEFTFSTPVDIGSIGSSGFYAVQIWANTSDYEVAGVYVYDSTVWSDATGGSPYPGKERGWWYKDNSWASGQEPAYQVICTDNPGNSAVTPTTTYVALGEYDATDKGGTAVRSYINLLPGITTGPTPADEASDVTLHDTTGTWVSGGNTDSYNVYYGTLSGFLELVEEGVTDLSLVLVDGNFSVYGKISYWRVDAVNTYGTTTGDEWYFTIMNFDPVLPTGITLDHSGGEGGVPTGTATGENNMMTVRRLVVAARNKIFYEV